MRIADPAIDEFSAYAKPDMERLGPIVERVLAMPEFDDLRDAEPTIEWLMRNETKIKQGRWIHGTAYTPQVTGELRDMFEWLLEVYFGHFPDFLIVLSRDYWEEANPAQREILVFHELAHCEHARDKMGALRYTKDGFPIFGLRGHDIEEFDAVVRRYGAHSEDLQRFIAAAADGDGFRQAGRPRA